MLVAGDTERAERELQGVLRREPGLVPAVTALGYVRLSMGRIAEASRGFEDVLRRRADYVPAVAGAAAAAQRAGDIEGALRAVPARPVARARGPAAAPPAGRGAAPGDREARGGRARRPAGGQRRARPWPSTGRPSRPRRRWRASASSWPRCWPGGGDKKGAVEVLEGDPTEDRQVLLQLGQLRTEMGEHGRALEAYRRVLARDPRDEEALRRSQEVRQALELLEMPEEYRAIASAPRISRAELAALLSVKVTALSRVRPGAPRVAIDISGSWAREHIIKVLGLDLIEVYPNHTFQPGATVRRGELARAVARVLDLLKWPPAPTPALADMTAGNLFHAAAARVVAAGLMDLTPAGAFEAWRPVSGQEAVDVIEGLIRLVGP